MIIPIDLRDCVAFVYYESANGAKIPAGTAFFIQDPEPTIGADLTTKYCVTARHVIESIVKYGHGGGVWLRLNRPNGEISWVNVPLTDWLGHPDETDTMWFEHRDNPRFDVSACIWRYPDSLLQGFGVVAPYTSVFVDDKKISEHAISAGDEVFMTGLFANHIGKRRNIPIVRCGNIAAMPEEPVETALGPMEAFLIEARSIGGLSGSPVFVSLGSQRLGKGGQYSLGPWYVYLLGLVHGHWDARRGDTVPDDTTNGASINQGIAVVAPATQILETIRQKKFMAIRAADIQAITTSPSQLGIAPS